MSGDVLGVAGQFLGFDAVTVSTTDDLALVSSDVDPALRLTVSKRLGRRFELVLSDNLDDNELTWVIIYRPRPGFEFRVALARQHRVHGRVPAGDPIRPRRLAPAVTRASAGGARPRGRRHRQRRAGLRAGRRALRHVARSRRRVRLQSLAGGPRPDRRGSTSSAGTSRRASSRPGSHSLADGGEPRVALDYRVTRGPRTVLSVSGYTPPPEVEDQLRQAWADSVLVDLLEADLARVMREHLVDADSCAQRSPSRWTTSRPDLVTATVQGRAGAAVDRAASRVLGQHRVEREGVARDRGGRYRPRIAVAGPRAAARGAASRLRRSRLPGGDSHDRRDSSSPAARPRCRSASSRDRWRVSRRSR